MAMSMDSLFSFFSLAFYMATERLHKCNYWRFYNIVTTAIIIHVIKFMETKQEVTCNVGRTLKFCCVT